MVSANLEQARANMVHQQIRTWEVIDQRVIDLLDELPRDQFCPEKYKNLAYTDTEIPLGNGQKMMAPKIEAKLLQALAIQSTDSVLEVGTGSGFLTACLAKLGKKVISLEIDSSLIPHAGSQLENLGIRNADLQHQDVFEHEAPSAPFEVIAVTGALPVIPDLLKSQMKVGGRMFVVTGEAPAMTACLITRVSAGDWRTEELFETELDALVNAPEESGFTF